MSKHPRVAMGQRSTKPSCRHSEAIAEYLNEQYPQPAMLPSDPGERARVRERSRFHDTRLEPALRQLFKYIPRTHRPADELALLGQAVNERLAQFDGLLRQAPANTKTLTLGDCGYAVTFEWIAALSEEMLTIQWPEQVKQWREQVAAHSAVAQELADYRPKLNAYLTATY